MTRHIPLLFIAALLTAPVRARAAEPSTDAKTKKPARTKEAKGTDVDNCQNLLKNAKEPFADLPINGDGKPLLPRTALNPTNLDSDTTKPFPEIDPKTADVRFKECRNTTTGTCDVTLFHVLRDVRTEAAPVKDLVTKIDQAKGACQADQAGAAKCSVKVYKESSKSFQDAADRFKKEAVELVADQTADRNEGNEAINAAKSASSAPADKLNNAANLLNSEAKTGDVADRAHQWNSCTTSARVSDTFCGHVVAASDAAFIAKKLEDASGQSQKIAQCLAGYADKTQKVVDKMGPVKEPGPTNTDTNTKSGLLGGMGLDDLLKMGTLGLTGASLYCSLTKNCGNGSQSTDPSTEEHPAATSPTPNSAASGSGIEKSALGDASGKSSAPPPGNSSDQSTTGNGQTAQHSGGPSGFGASEPLLNQFGGNLGKGSGPLAANVAGASSGGGGSNGIGGGTLPLTASGDGAATRAPASDTGSGFAPSGGGLASAGTGFSLGDSHNSSPTDNALKSILNGDTPAGASPEAPPGGLDGATPGVTAGADAGMDDPENLFVRVKDTHLRCLKRGCVGREIGSNI